MRKKVLIAEVDRAAQKEFRFVIASPFADDEPKLREGIDVVRLEFEHSAKGGFTNVIRAQPASSDADEIIRFGPVWKTLGGPLKKIERFVVLKQQEVCPTKARVVNELRWILIQGSLIKF